MLHSYKAVAQGHEACLGELVRNEGLAAIQTTCCPGYGPIWAGHSHEIPSYRMEKE